ncbi:hypothetical protein Pmani_034899 [Petrolisthes manimaculis]|uniref:Uncharacterized protein n=1 Tax=Petrolisthes manimaculis TaxID=1843537 RepID=A0AAE1NNE7_9EUCA|nr:hypothetical protein Pmani_034899 [Petrolisthes manimaculis]
MKINEAHINKNTILPRLYAKNTNCDRIRKVDPVAETKREDTACVECKRKRVRTNSQELLENLVDVNVPNGDGVGGGN